MLRDIQVALKRAEATLAPKGVRGSFDARAERAVIQVRWASPFGSRTDVERQALREAVVELIAAGYQAEMILGLSWVRVMGPGIGEQVSDWRDGEAAVHSVDATEESEAECLAAE